MPNPKTLSVGDRITFIHFPEEWQRASSVVLEEDSELMRRMLGKTYKIRYIDEYGHPWIGLTIKEHDHYNHHSWAIMETTGWVKEGADGR